MDRTELSQRISEIHRSIVVAHQINATCDATERRFWSNEIRRLEKLFEEAMCEI